MIKIFYNLKYKKITKKEVKKWEKKLAGEDF